MPRYSPQFFQQVRVNWNGVGLLVLAADSESFLLFRAASSFIAACGQRRRRRSLLVFCEWWWRSLSVEIYSQLVSLPHTCGRFIRYVSESGKCFGVILSFTLVQSDELYVMDHYAGKLVVHGLRSYFQLNAAALRPIWNSDHIRDIHVSVI